MHIEFDIIFLKFRHSTGIFAEGSAIARVSDPAQNETGLDLATGACRSLLPSRYQRQLRHDFPNQCYFVTIDHE